MSHAQLTLQDADVITSALEDLRTSFLGLFRCLVPKIARKAGHLLLGTFDKGLARIDGAHGL